MLRAIIVDDEELAIKWLKKLLTESGDVEIVQSFRSPQAAYDYVKTNSVDVAFLDISMPGINGIGLASLLVELSPSMDIVFVTAHDHYAVQAFDVSAADYLLKPVTAQRMAKALHKIRKKHGTEAEPESTGTVMLTEQEKRIIRLIADGLSNREMADRLCITPETVKFHIKNVYRKLNVSNRVQVLRRAQSLKL
jgi:DNA-binding NarL/FixJ family response regulator